MFDGDRDLPVLTSGNYVIKGRVISGLWNYTYGTSFNIFLRIFQMSKIHHFLRIFELMHTHSRTPAVAAHANCGARNVTAHSTDSSHAWHSPRAMHYDGSSTSQLGKLLRASDHIFAVTRLCKLLNLAVMYLSASLNPANYTSLRCYHFWCVNRMRHLRKNDGHENDGPKMTAGHEVAGEQIEF